MMMAMERTIACMQITITMQLSHRGIAWHVAAWRGVRACSPLMMGPEGSAAAVGSTQPCSCPCAISPAAQAAGEPA